jgi:ADP-heptose:LPS heptosyltransferase
VKRVIVTHFGTIGDQVLSTPALLGLKRKFDWLTMVCPSRMAGLLENLDLVDKFILFDPDSKTKEALLKKFAKDKNHAFLREVQEIEEHEKEYLLEQNEGLIYDHNLNFHGTMVGPIVWRKGSENFERASLSSGKGALLNRLEHRNSNYTDQFLLRAGVTDLVLPTERAPLFRLSRQEKRRVKNWKKRRGIKPNDILLMWQLCGSGPNKIYPHFGRVVVELMLRYPMLKVVISGDEKSAVTAEKIFKTWPQLKVESQLVHRLFSNCGKYDLRTSATLVDACDIFIGPDTGFFHIAQALEKYQVLIIAHTEPHVVTKYYRNCESVMSPWHCAPCHRIIDSPRCPDYDSPEKGVINGWPHVDLSKGQPTPCMDAIKPERIINKATKFINEILLSRRSKPYEIKKMGETAQSDDYDRCDRFFPIRNMGSYLRGHGLPDQAG